ncbi:hypothetical protein N9X25_04770 [Verrucomicrobiales bacterium]|nr:hypothetical protein [Verrucomicrobiales bacterium]
MNLCLQVIKCLSIAIPAMMLASCNDSDMGPEGSDIVVREIPDAHRDFKLVDTSRERFRYQTRPASSADAGQSTGPRLVYATPKGWTDEGRSMMRDVNFSFGENGEGECYVARLPGAGGGLSANVNRWRKQMGADPLSDDEVFALPKKKLFGQPATFMSVDGDFTGMGASGAQKDYRLLGVILSADTGAIFVKMTGPRKLVEANAAQFDEFVSSLNVTTGN